MNQNQLKYARERAESINRRAQQKLRDRFLYPKSQMTAEQKLAALKAGEFKVLPGKSRCWTDSIAFNGEPRSDEDKYNTEIETLRREFDGLMDQLVLGDQTAALAMLKTFEEKFI